LFLESKTSFRVYQSISIKISTLVVLAITMPLTIQKRTTVTTTYPAVCPAITVVDDPVFFRSGLLAPPVIEESITTYPAVVCPEPWEGEVLVEEVAPPLELFTEFNEFGQFPPIQLNDFNQFNANQFDANQFNANQFNSNQFNVNQFNGNQFNANQFNANQFNNNQLNNNQFNVANKYHPADVRSDAPLSEVDPLEMLNVPMRTRNLSGGTQWDYDAGDNNSLFDPMRRLSMATEYSTATAHFEDQHNHHLGDQHGHQQILNGAQQFPPQMNQSMGLTNQQFSQQTNQHMGQSLLNQGNQQLGQMNQQQLNLLPNQLLGQPFNQSNQHLMQHSLTEPLITEIPILEHGMFQSVQEPLPWERQAVFHDERPVMNWERPMMMSEQMSQNANWNTGAQGQVGGQSTLPREPELPKSNFVYTSGKPFTEVLQL
jgi:hypothetical protein